MLKHFFSKMYLLVCWSVIVSIPVSAYLDPSVMTYTIQAVAGIIIAVGAAVTIYWRKAKKKISDKLGIDENANKEIESDEIIISETEKK